MFGAGQGVALFAFDFVFGDRRGAVLEMTFGRFVLRVHGRFDTSFRRFDGVRALARHGRRERFRQERHFVTGRDFPSTVQGDQTENIGAVRFKAFQGRFLFLGFDQFFGSHRRRRTFRAQRPFRVAVGEIPAVLDRRVWVQGAFEHG